MPRLAVTVPDPLLETAIPAVRSHPQRASCPSAPLSSGCLPVGRLELVAEGDRVVALSIATDGVLPLDHLDDRPSAVLAETSRQLGEYFAGLRTSFDVPVRLTGTPFQVAVWEALARVPHGGVTTYGALAQAAGVPAGRARWAAPSAPTGSASSSRAIASSAPTGA
ncbi:Methylated-DNA--protein-cysteine methyltransferase, constitutive [Clavibacter michiganensis subsp. michiganensis]|uniref:Methylated-DNA--protein-cysteine methyltransferase, constitutive n=1 Tax=Clavibacter michiganensis subsp. michiganensis TaxID=33013 RepID=A0A251XGZ3_CLAMM|nr:Methylated-DNA--protein-cysteine methyltransferase, constitutive [Clavibacter michiganensis subsp. michiganensis]OUE01554.1 Methylated-DNA--protein-cysteine methyltransferase, constitutive [Clavibacter michiganensis subsp. michiganensis]